MKHFRLLLLAVALSFVLDASPTPAAIEYHAPPNNRSYYTFDTAPVLPLTLAAWVNYKATPDFVTFSVGNSATNDYIAIGSEAQGPDDHQAWTYDGDASADIGSAISINTWYHVAGVFRSDSDRELAVDGVLTGSTNTDTQSTITYNRVGVSVSADNTPFGDFDGRLAELAIWDVELTAAELASLATGYSPLLIRPSNLIFYLPAIRHTIDDQRMSGVALQTLGTNVLSYPHPRTIYP